MYLFNRLRAFRQAKVFRKWSVMLCVVGGVLWVVCCVHGVSNLGQKSDRSGPKSVENRPKINGNLVSVRLGTMLGRGSRQGRFKDGPPGKKSSFFTPLCAKMAPKRRLFGNPENRKWHQNRPVEAKDRHWDPLKTLSGSGFERTRKINDILIGK